MTIVAIDGPAGAGKSTVARRVAESLGFRYIDTGAMYRALALGALLREVDLTDGPAVAALAPGVVVTRAGIEFEGRDVSRAIRSAEVTGAVSLVAAHPEVRKALATRQRRTAAAGDCVMEGRDIGTSVCPDAEVKIFLTASSSERARRRWEQLGSPESPSVEDVEASIVQRDRDDSGRAVSPLQKASDAHVIDTTDKTIDEIVGSIVALARGISADKR